MKHEKVQFITEYLNDNFGIEANESTGLSCLTEEQQNQLAEVLKENYYVSVTGGHIRDCIRCFGDMRVIELAVFVQDRYGVKPS